MSEFSEVPADVASATSQERTSTPKTPVVVPQTTMPSPEMDESSNKIDLLIVFGQGPVKPLLLDRDLNKDPTGEMRKKWNAFKEDPLHNTEPDFRILELDSHVSQQGEELNPYLKALAGKNEAEVDALMAKWQKQGRFGLNRWGREEALATGFALVSGHSERAVLSGGKTKPPWAKDVLSPQRLEAMGSEAELMKDIIVRTFGDLYSRMHNGKSIEEALILEEGSTNTLENFANTVNLNPEVLEKGVAAGLATDFHVPRTERIGYLFTGQDEFSSDSAQVLLQQRLDRKNERRKDMEVVNIKTGEVKPVGNKKMYREIIDWMMDPKNPDLKQRAANEEAFDFALHDPDFLTNWIGYIGIVEDPSVLQKTVQRLASDPSYLVPATEVFNIAGLDFNRLSKDNFETMPREEFDAIREKLRILMLKENRRLVELPKV